MNHKEFVQKLNTVLTNRLSQFAIIVEQNRLPASVEFTVVSNEFEQMGRGGRVRFLAAICEEAFGLPPTFMPMGLCLTMREFGEPCD